MRCINCGWENQNESQICERCSSPLDCSSSSKIELPYGSSNETTLPLRSTVREATIENHYVDSSNLFNETTKILENNNVCNSCGYSLSSNMNICPQCGKLQRQQQTESEKNKQNEEKRCLKCGSLLINGAQYCPNCGQSQQKRQLTFNNRGTVNAWDNPQNGEFCSLRPIPWARENVEYNAISFSGERITLNRANTDPNNQSITSHEQAVLTYDGKDWYIENLSDQHSTMLRISRKTKLQSGDVIALGNRLFEFKD